VVTIEDGVVGVVELTSDGGTDSEGVVDSMISGFAVVSSVALCSDDGAVSGSGSGLDCCLDGSSTCSEENSASFRRLRGVRGGKEDSATEYQGSYGNVSMSGNCNGEST